MKKIVVIFCILFFSNSIVGATKDVIFKFSQKDFMFEYDNMEYLSIKCIDYPSFYEEDISMPALPMLIIDVLVEDSWHYSNMSFLLKEESYYEHISMARNKIPIPTNNKSVISYPNFTIFSNSQYPETNVDYMGTIEKEDGKYIKLKVCPFRYEPISKRLTLFKEIQIHLEQEVGTGQRDANAHKNERYNRFYFSQDFVQSDTYKYVIITNDNLAPYFQPLANWKTIKGMRAKVVTMEEIYAQDNSNDSPSLKLKKWINAQRTLHNISNILLGGDESIVPVQRCYGNYLYKNENEEYEVVNRDPTMPSDLFYSCVEGALDWDANENGIIGEMEDNVVFDMLLNVSRIPVRTISDVNQYVAKVISYESNPPISRWKNNLLQSGHKLGIMVFGEQDSISDAQYKGDFLYNHYIHPYWTGQNYRLYDTENDFLLSNPSFTRSNLQEQLSHGYTFVDVITHGDSSCWVTDDELYNIQYAENLANKYPSVITTMACTTNAFDLPNYDPCLSEALIRNSNANVLAYIGGSREGLYMPGTAFGPSYSLNAWFYKNIFDRNDGTTLMRALKSARNTLTTLASYRYYGSERWVLFSVNPIGDPDMPIYKEAPKQFPMPEIINNNANNSLTVLTHVDECKIYLVSDQDLGESYYREVSYSDSATFTNIPDSASLSIVKNGYVPLIIKLINGNIVLNIQNKTIDDDGIVNADIVNIGRNVTTDMLEGPVTIECGTTNIIGKQNVYIKNSFEVKKGAELIIETTD